jgi:hypothetical protein
VATAQDVAQWMLSETKKTGYLEQAWAVSEIEDRFGEEFTYINDRGANAIDREVLKAFRELSGNTVVWARVSRYWRPRESGDEPGRTQYE